MGPTSQPWNDDTSDELAADLRDTLLATADGITTRPSLQAKVGSRRRRIRQRRTALSMAGMVCITGLGALAVNASSEPSQVETVSNVGPNADAETNEPPVGQSTGTSQTAVGIFGVHKGWVAFELDSEPITDGPEIEPLDANQVPPITDSDGWIDGCALGGKYQFSVTRGRLEAEDSPSSVYDCSSGTDPAQAETAHELILAKPTITLDEPPTSDDHTLGLSDGTHTLTFRPETLLAEVRPDIPAREVPFDELRQPSGEGEISEAEIANEKWLASTMTDEDAERQLSQLSSYLAADPTGHEELMESVRPAAGERYLLAIPRVGAGWLEVDQFGPDAVNQATGRGIVYRASTGKQTIGEYDGSSFFPAGSDESIVVDLGF